MTQSTTTPEATTGRNTRGLFLLSTGVVFAIAAVVMLFITVVGISTLQSDALARINEQNLSYRAEFGFVERELSVLSAMTAVPAMLLIVAVCFLIPGYLRRRGVIAERDTTFWRGGSHTAKYKPLPLGLHAAWALLPLAAWVLLVVIPLRNLIGGTAWPAGLKDENSSAVWMLLAAYGGLAAALFAAIVVSLIKKVVYTARVARHPEAVDGSAGKGLWRWVTFRWRFDLWLAGLGGAFVGLCWIALGFDDTPFFVTTLAIGLALLAAGLLLAVNYWRAGEPLGAGESYS
ncbi:MULTISPECIES: hypothetical protein [unclassified Cryobacterium]|uniref:hypothetical protein n=1 Tax=unclassified Cryobacterium TaxID=2649013 RepID=UPI00106D9FE4|nr:MULTISPECIES: hypothetical protein [unclassified Cryobacterium]TFC56955.1 hypothetical protein E3O68_02985 [Cryobacterium sp. TMB3-1-2]TFC59897.1 hypothetical protein E3O60_07360 [Cryobacterium sp. TMB1-7]TFC67912.1 hypothetical protein E3T21_15785 [Cryobacterium sp. TMB3-15]TFC76831.1 hypothetical protein E3T22_07695 [Cryobacterium sp. TMB3-10]TFC91467.1 hypothetical protein E3T19_04020 [Cryobacterium sp. TMT4-31]